MFYRLRGWLQNIVASRTETYYVQEASLSLLSMRMKLRLYWPALDMSSILTNFFGRLNSDCFLTGNGDGSLVAEG